MKELYFTCNNRKTIQVVRLEYGQLGEKFVLKIFEGEGDSNGLFLHKSIFPREEVFDDEQEKLKQVLETRKQLSEEKWVLKTEEESPKTIQT